MTRKRRIIFTILFVLMIAVLISGAINQRQLIGKVVDVGHAVGAKLNDWIIEGNGTAPLKITDDGVYYNEEFSE